jgi:hypothetical protein
MTFQAELNRVESVPMAVQGEEILLTNRSLPLVDKTADKIDE